MGPVDLERLIEIIVEEMAAAGGGRAPTPVCLSLGSVRVLPRSRGRGVLDAGATRLGLHAAGGGAGGVAAMIDHTLLKPDATRARSRRCAARRRSSGSPPSASTPRGWPPAHGSFAAARVGVCSVVGFPLGATTADVKQYETRRAIFDGAREIDMVINVGALKSGDLQPRRARHRGGDLGLPRDGRAEQGDHRGRAPDRRREGHGLHAGQGRGGGLREDVNRLRSRRRDRRGRRADAARRRRRHGRQGVRAACATLEGVKAMVAAGATRIGASAGVRIVQQSRGQQPAEAAKGY